MGKNRTVQKTRVKNLKNKMDENIEVDYDEASDLENDNDLNQVNESSHKCTAKSNSRNLRNFENFSEDVEENGDDGENIGLESDMGLKTPRKSFHKNQIKSNSPDFSNHVEFSGGEAAGDENVNGDEGEGNTQFPSQTSSHEHVLTSKGAKTSIRKKGKPSGTTESPEDVINEKVPQKTKSYNTTPRSKSQDDHKEADEAHNSDAEVNQDPAPSAIKIPKPTSKRKIREGNRDGIELEDDKD